MIKQKWVQAYIDVAERFAQLSSARRLKVGAVVVKDNKIISIGYNGTPSGWDNTCEEVIEQHEDGGQILQTLPEVIHAERNALDKLARTDGGGEGAYLFVTHSPCMECSKSIYSVGISKVFYKHDYKNNDGVEFLQKCGIEVIKI